MKKNKFLQSQFVFWPHEEVKNDLSVFKNKLSSCLSYKENHDIVFVKEPVEIQIQDPKIIMMGEQELKRVEKMKLYLEDSINDMLTYFKREREYLSKIFFQTFSTFENSELTKRSIKETKESVKMRFKERVKESPPEIKEDMVLLI